MASCVVQCVVLGEGAVGKSALTIRSIKGHFIDEYDPTIEDAYSKSITVDDKVFQLDVLDTAGQEEYSAMREMYLETGEAFVVVYAVNNRDSFEGIQDTFVPLIERVKDAAAKDVPIVLVGNKCDLDDEREIPRDEGAAYARRIGAQFLETSACTGVNVPAIFETVIRLVVAAREREANAQDANTADKRKARGLRRLAKRVSPSCKVL